MSVPNQYSADGSRVRRAGASAVGSTVARYGAATATKMISTSSMPPITIVVYRCSSVRAGPRARTGGSTSGSATAGATWATADAATGASMVILNSVSSDQRGGRAGQPPD